jgi:hypothetical protein
MKKENMKDWNKAECLTSLNKLEITQNPKTRTITTKYDGREISKYTPTKEYQLVRFGEVAESFIDKVLPHFKPEKWYLRLSEGVQELRLLGEEFTFCGDIYRKQAILISSTDGTRTLSFMVGLFRQICSNGAVAKVSGDCFRVRHLKSNKDVVKIASMQFGDMDKAFNGLMSKIEQTKDKTISLQKLRSIIYDKKSGRGASNYLAIVAKLYASKTDKLDAAKYRTSFVRIGENGAVTVSPEILKAKEIKLKVPMYTAYQALTEYYRAHDSATIESQSERFLEAALA